MSDDEYAKRLLNVIAELATCLYPVKPGSDLNDTRAATMGAIRAMAKMAAEDPPRLSPLLSEDHEADIANDLATLSAYKAGSRELRALFKEHGIDDRLPWPDWIAAIRKHLDAISSKGE